MMDEQAVGILWRNGDIVESYNKQFDELVRTFTDQGINKIKEILKDPKYRKIFAQTIYDETIGMSKDDKIRVLIEIKKILEYGQKTRGRM